MTRATDEVLELERQFWTRADDPDHFRSSYADQGLTVLEPMGFIGKDQAVKMVADRPWNEVEMEDVEIREVTPDVVIVAYHGTGAGMATRSPTGAASRRRTSARTVAGSSRLPPTSRGRPRSSGTDMLLNRCAMAPSGIRLTRH